MPLFKRGSRNKVSNWKSVLSGVTQGSVLRPLLFLICVNDLDANITSNVLNYKKKHLQNNLDKLVKWSEKCQMLLIFGKCKCLHTGHGNLDVNCSVYYCKRRGLIN